ncbi:MAG: glycosyltransferase family 2 protein [Alphaproteobacteria bacterium]
MSSQKPGLLSVIIPNYNYGAYIAETMASVAAQDYAPIELIVVDDASTDDSVKAMKASAADMGHLERVEIVPLDTNVGKLGAMNRGLEMIEGEYLIILDSDDRLVPDYASRCIAELKSAHAANQHIGFVYTDCNLISAEGDFLDRGRSTAFKPELLEIYSFIPEPAVCLASIVTDSAPYDESIRRGTKHHKWTRIVGKGWHGHYLPEPLFEYRMHDANISGIGKRVLDEVDEGKRGERILSGYWPTQQQQ